MYKVSIDQFPYLARAKDKDGGKQLAIYDIGHVARGCEIFLTECGIAVEVIKIFPEANPREDGYDYRIYVVMKIFETKVETDWYVLKRTPETTEGLQDAIKRSLCETTDLKIRKQIDDAQKQCDALNLKFGKFLKLQA